MIRSFIPHPDELAALLDGRQTMLRRPVKFRYPAYDHPENICRFTNPQVKDDAVTFLIRQGWRTTPIKFPWVVGDELWVRETWSVPMPHYWHKTSEMLACGVTQVDVVYKADGKEYHRWKSSTHMPRWASRLTLEVLEVRVERVQDITAKECVLEGCLPNNWSPNSWFADRWDARYADAFPWASNPHVWVAKVRRQDDR